MRTVLVVFLLAAGCGDDTGPGGNPDGPGGSGGAGGSGGSGGSGGTGGCPTYQAMCGGRCIPISNDPDNCGGCGHVCTAQQTCSAGACTSGCLLGLTVCDRSCVDINTDNRHCGNCTTACPSGTGCVEGMCRPGLTSGNGPPCPNGGPPTTETPDGGAPTCNGNMAQTTFRWAICSCTDVDISQNLLTDAYDSTMGPYMPGGLGGGVGLDGVWRQSAPADIWGALWSSSSGMLRSSQDVSVKQEFHLGGSYMSSRPWTVGADAFVVGDIMTSSSLAITGVLHVPATSVLNGNITYASVVRAPVSVPPPCDCAPQQLIPIGAFVAAHQTSNDNASIGLDPAALTMPGNASRLDLPCGNYYLNEVTGARPITIAAHGRTALYIGGDIRMSAPLRITLDPTAELDVFLAGTLNDSQSLTIGSPNYPALTRIYIGSPLGFNISQGAILGAFFYAAYGPVTISATLDVYGGVIAGDFRASQAASIHYDRAVLTAGGNCGTPTPPPGGCTSCRDCGNQACVNGTCGACTDSSQCCAPLLCVQGRCLANIP